MNKMTSMMIRTASFTSGLRLNMTLIGNMRTSATSGMTKTAMEPSLRRRGYVRLKRQARSSMSSAYASCAFSARSMDRTPSFSKPASYSSLAKKPTLFISSSNMSSTFAMTLRKPNPMISEPGTMSSSTARSPA